MCPAGVDVPVPEKMDNTGKKNAVIGGGPSGLSAAYFLSIMGHKVTVFEKRAHELLHTDLKSWSLDMRQDAEE